MRLVNIVNDGRNVSMFCRDENGKLFIEKDNSVYPYYYEPQTNGEFTAYDGVKLRKVFCTDPREIAQVRSAGSYSSDIPFVKNYMIHHIDKLEKTEIKYIFLDIEVLCEDGFPEPEEAKYPVSCITTYNSASSEFKTWWLPEYKNEKELLDSFIDYIKEEAPDMLLAWNIHFDYTYLFNRAKDFAKRISPISKERYQGKDNCNYPAGISIVDYLMYFKKVFMAEQSYKLDDVSVKYLGDDNWGDTIFGLSDRVREKNVNDVVRMVQLEQKNNLIPYYDEIRRMVKCQWEDLYYNSRIVENLIFIEAKANNIVMPNKLANAEKTDFKGATREAPVLGLLYDIGKFDLGCYSEDTEILTINGWQSHHKLTTDSIVATFNTSKNKIEFDNILHMHRYKVKNEIMHNFKNLFTNQLVTFNHKMLYKNTINSYRGIKNNTEDWKICYATDFRHHHSILPLSAPVIDIKDYPISDTLLKVHAWIITEGSNKQKKETQNNNYCFGQSLAVNKKYCNEIDELFNILNWKVYTKIRNRKKPFKCWALNVENSKQINLESDHKIIPLWMLHSLSIRQLNILLLELMKGDGCKRDSTYCAKSQLARDRFQYLCTLLGKSSSDNCKSSIRFRKEQFTSISKKTKQTVNYTGTVWCPTVKNGFVVVRRKGQVFVSGNSAYPTMIDNFCLDPMTISDEPTEETICVDGIHFRQDKDALLPGIVRKILTIKDSLKIAVKKDPSLMFQYKAIKAIVNCFSSDTNILTVDGIKNIKDVKIKDKVYNVNPETLEVEIDEIEEIYQYDYDGLLHHHTADLTDLMVTDEHRFLVQKWYDDNYEFKTIEELATQKNKKYGVPKITGIKKETSDIVNLFSTLLQYKGTVWIKHPSVYSKRGEKINNFVSVKRTKKIGDKKYSSWRIASADTITEAQLISLYQQGWDIYGQITLRTQLTPLFYNKQDFLSFLGWFISEGSIYKSKFKKYERTARGGAYKITISQCQSVNLDYYNEIEHLLLKLNLLRFSKGKKSFSMCFQLLFLYLRDNCGKNSFFKKVPSFVFEESGENILHLLDSLYKGDGNKRGIRYTTSSAQLKIDVIKLYILSGNNAIKYKDYPKLHRIAYSNSRKAIRKKTVTQKYYKDKVYCIKTKKNHCVYAGRNGTLSLTGQSTYGVMGNQYFRLYDKRVAAATTYLVRDVLMYCKDALEEAGHEIVYWDTDALFLQGKEDISESMNQMIQEWGKKFGKEEVKLYFESEGSFDSIFIMGKCLFGGTAVKTNKGYVPISKIYKESDKYLVFSVNTDNNIELVKIKKVWKTDRRNRTLYQVNTHGIGQKNNKAIFTADHPILTNNGWKQIQELESTDLICTGKMLPSKERREFILGTVLGDSSLGGSSLSFGHSIKQKEYAKYKADIIFGDSFTFREVTDNKGYQKVRYRYHGVKQEKSDASYFRTLEPKIYKNINGRKTKILTEEVLEDFTLISLAVLWMDDGGICKKRQYAGSIATCNFTESEVYLLSDAIKKLGLDNFVRKTENKYFRIAFNSKQVKKVCEKIAPYIPKCMEYKIYPEYRFIRKHEICLQDNKTELLYSSFSMQEYKDNNPVVYDLEVVKNHNFITRAGVVHNCHYFGYVAGEEKPEIKGMEMKRSSSSNFEARFQRELLDKLIDKSTQAEIVEWIKEEQKHIKEVPIIEMASPCKISNKVYKNVPIFVRAYNNTQNIHKSFKMNTGELFYYVYVHQRFGEVLAFSKEDNSFVNWKECIDWKKVIDRNIIKKAEAIFKVLKWDLGLIDTSGQLTFMF